MRIFRCAVVVMTQVPLLYFELGRHDMLGGFNQTDAGFGLLLGLFVMVPILILAWLLLETVIAIRLAKKDGFSRTVLLPFFALAILLESLAIDLYLLSHARM